MSAIQPVELLKEFVHDYLNDNIDKLVSFHLAGLKSDSKYGCPDRRFDCDDCNIMRAIYCVAFGDVWANLSMENCGDGMLRGDTINSCATFFSYPWDDKFTPKWNPPYSLKNKIDCFQRTFHTVGNMTLLPDRRIGEWSINKHRGCHDEWHDYEDRFLAALYKVLLNNPDKDPDLEELVTLNYIDFEPFFGNDGWRKFIDGNILTGYVNEDYSPIIISKGYTWWRGGYINRERYFEEANRYIDHSTMIITYRGQRIVERIKQAIEKQAI